MAFQLTYAGCPLRLIDPETLRSMQSTYPFVDTMEVQREIRVGGRLSKLSPPVAYNPKIGLNEYWYPTGASRYSIFRGLVAAADLATIEATVYGTTTSPAPFVVRSDADVTDTGITTNLYMLPPRPIVDLGGSSGGYKTSQLYLITLVDERFWFDRTPAGFIDCSGLTSTDTWSNLVATLATTLNIHITVAEAIEAVYGYPEPDSALYSNNESAAVLLDVALANVGRYLIRNLDGSYTAVRGNTTLATCQADRPTWTKRLGGGQVLADTEAATDATRGPLLPASFTVSFPDWQTGIGYTTANTNYRSFTIDSYSYCYNVSVLKSTLGAPYAAMSHTSEVVALRTTAKALYGSSGPPTNAATLQALANQLTTDWIDSQLQYLDETYRGIVSASPAMGLDIHWNYNAPSTRVMRNPFGYAFNEFQHGFGGQIAKNFTVERADGTEAFNNVTTLQVGPVDAWQNSLPATATDLIEILPASTLNSGIVSYIASSTQLFGGSKGFNNGLYFPILVGGPSYAGSFAFIAGSTTSDYGLHISIPNKAGDSGPQEDIIVIDRNSYGSGFPATNFLPTVNTVFQPGAQVNIGGALGSPILSFVATNAYNLGIFSSNYSSPNTSTAMSNSVIPANNYSYGPLASGTTQDSRPIDFIGGRQSYNGWSFGCNENYFYLNAPGTGGGPGPTKGYAFWTGSVWGLGQTGTGGGGDTFAGGICTALGSGPSLAVGTTPITGGTSADVLTNVGGVLGNASMSSLQSYSAQNKDTSAIATGNACSIDSSGTGFNLASAASSAKPAVGLASAGAAVGFAAAVQTQGLLQSANWSAVQDGGGTTLAAHAIYWLSPTTPGNITSTAPTTAGQIVQRIGRAVSTDTLEISIGDAILL